MRDLQHLGYLDIDAVTRTFLARGLDEPSPHDYWPKGLLHRTVFLRSPANAPRGAEMATAATWGADGEVEDFPVLQDWPEMQALLAEARRMVLAAPLMEDFIEPDAPLARAALSIILPRGYVHWHIDPGTYARNHARFHVPLITDEKALSYFVGEPGQHIRTGALTYLNTDVPHSAGNGTDHIRAHAIFELRRKGRH